MSVTNFTRLSEAVTNTFSNNCKKRSGVATLEARCSGQVSIKKALALEHPAALEVAPTDCDYDSNKVRSRGCV